MKLYVRTARIPHVLLLSLACACAPAGLPADGTTETGDDSTETGETGETGEDQAPAPTWSVEFDSVEGGVVQDFEVADTGEILVIHLDLNEEGGVYGFAHKLDADGTLLWSTAALERIPERLCANADGEAYLITRQLSDLPETSEPQLAMLDADGEMVWSVDIAPQLQPAAHRLALTCDRSDDSVFVVGTGSDNAGFLAHYDNTGAEIDLVPNIYAPAPGGPNTWPRAVILDGDAELLVSAVSFTEGDTALTGLVSRLDAAGSAVVQHELVSDLSLGPWLATRSGTRAAAALVTTTEGWALSVHALDEDLTTLWSDVSLPGLPSECIRAVTVDDAGRIFAAVPTDDQQLRLAIYVDEQPPTTMLLSELPGWPSALGIAADGQLLVGGALDRAPWLASYDL